MKAFLCPVMDQVIGGHMHRSGWPYVMKSLSPLFSDKAKLIFDDFLEKTICNCREGRRGLVHSRPWVGVCHYPHDAPSWYETEHLQDLPRQKSWSESLENLRLCIALGENLASWIRENWSVPCVTLRHPTEIPDLQWSVDKFTGNTDPLLLQVGWYLRNTHAIFQVDAPRFLSKAWLRSRRDIAERNHALCGLHLRHERYSFGDVREIEPVSNDAYDVLLSENIVFVNLITSVANNTVVECIARNTPIVINRRDSTEYYLGRDYPLFYDELGELRGLISSDRIVAAHQYLRALDKEWLHGSVFRDELAKSCIEHVSPQEMQ